MDESAKKEIIKSVPIIDTSNGNRLGMRYTVRLSQDGEEEIVDIDCMIPNAPVLPVNLSSPVPKEPIAPVETQAALVRLFLDWDKKSDTEKYTLTAESTTKGILQYLNLVGAKGVRIARLGDPADEDVVVRCVTDTVLSNDYNDYVNGSYLEFVTDDKRKYWIPIQEEFKRSLDRYCDKIIWDYIDAYDKAHDGDFEKLDVAKAVDELKANVEDALGEEYGYPMADFLIKRCTRRLLNRDYYHHSNSSKKPIKTESIDDDENRIDNEQADSFSVDARVFAEDTLAELKGKLSSERQREIFGYMMCGYSQREIADKLGISAPAVSGHVKKIRDALKPDNK